MALVTFQQAEMEAAPRRRPPSPCRSSFHLPLYQPFLLFSFHLRLLFFFIAGIGAGPCQTAVQAGPLNRQTDGLMWASHPQLRYYVRLLWPVKVLLPLLVMSFSAFKAGLMWAGVRVSPPPTTPTGAESSVTPHGSEHSHLLKVHRA